MARLWSSGFELNSLTAGVEFDTVANTSNLFSIVTSPVRSGQYSLKLANNSFSAREVRQSVTSGTAHIFIRFYFYVSAYPNATTFIYQLMNGGNWGIRITTTGTLQLMNGASQIGSDSSALSLSQWYRVELEVDTTPASGSRVMNAYLDGTNFAGASNLSLSTNPLTVRLCANVNTEGDSALICYFDDIAVNDNTGSFQNTLPGSGKIIYLRPNGAGDSTQWTPDTGNNYARVQEVTPDDATSLVSDVILNDSDLYNVDNSGIGASDTVNLVAVGVRFRNDVADTTTAFKVQIEKTSGGTISQSSAITPNSTTWKTNATASPFNYPLTLYQDPDGAAWTQTTLDSMQIGQQSTLIGVNKNQVSTIWALVEYTPATSTTSTSTTSTSTSSSTTTTTSTSTTTTSTSSSTSTSTTSTSSSTSTSTTRTTTSTSTSTTTTTTSTSTSTSSSTSTTTTSTSTSTTTTVEYGLKVDKITQQTLPKMGEEMSIIVDKTTQGN